VKYSGFVERALVSPTVILNEGAKCGSEGGGRREEGVQYVNASLVKRPSVTYDAVVVQVVSRKQSAADAMEAALSLPFP
jgi:hypothetical protein